MKIAQWQKYFETKTPTQLKKIKSSIELLKRNIPCLFDEFTGLSGVLTIVNYTLNQKSKK